MKISLATKDLVTPDEAASQLNVHRTTLYRWIALGKIVCVQIGKSTLIPKSEIKRLKEKRNK